jgi:hypothetical protein
VETKPDEPGDERYPDDEVEPGPAEAPAGDVDDARRQPPPDYVPV